MTLEHSQVIALLKEMYLFSGLDEAGLNRASLLFSQIDYAAQTEIITAGKYADGFYIVAQGEVALTYLQRAGNDLLDILVPGDFFGVEPLMTRHPSQFTAATVGAATLLVAEPQQFNDLLVQFPDIKINMQRIVETDELIRRRHFNWLNEDEVVYQARRKHEAFLLITLIWPAVAVLAILLMALGGVMLLSPSTLQIVFLSLTGILFLAGLGWAGWNLLDWMNDYYVVTSQRVVWIEKVIFLYESRVEAPHATIQAVNVSTSFLGRLLGFGNVTISTFTGKVILTNVGEPYQMSAIIQEHWHRAKRVYQESEKKELDDTMRRTLYPNRATDARPVKVAVSTPKSDDYQEPGLVRNYFGNFFEMRFQEGTTTTYRKHWIMLLGKAWKPTLTALLIIGGLLGCTGAYYLRDIRIVSPLLVVGVGLALLLLLVLPWWLYNYVDWRNDIYQLTDRNIFDIERKPFGTETRKSASLEKILSLEHERPGFLGYLLNVGNVVINFGDAKFTFDGVYEPARVQQEVFTRMHQLRLQQQKSEVGRERERILELFEVYHRIANSDSETEDNPGKIAG